MLLLALMVQTSALSAVRTFNACAVLRARPKSIGFALSSRLKYADDDKMSLERSYEGSDEASKVWWPFTAEKEATVQDEESAKVDEYLAFLDRRYHMIHDEEQEQPSTKHFSALKWLRQGTDDSDVQQQQQADALQVLGLAGLASERLLREHHLQTRSMATKFVDVTDVQAVADVPQAVVLPAVRSLRIPTVMAVAFAKLGPMVQRLALQRDLLVKYQSLQVRSTLATLMHSLKVAPPRAARALWKFGGGRKNIGWTLSVMVALILCVIKPLLRQVLRQAASA